MSSFTEDHVKNVFDQAGYGVLIVDGDRGGIVQGDGLRIVVSPYVEKIARRFGADGAALKEIMDQARASRPFKLELYGGSVSAHLEGVYFRKNLVDFMKEECRNVYYRAQHDINAIFAAEDPPNAEWDPSREANVGIVDQFAAETAEGDRIFVRVLRVADQSFNPYESDDPEYTQTDVADILEGRASHGAVEVEVYQIEPDRYGPDGAAPQYSSSLDEYDPSHFTSSRVDLVYRDNALIWTRDATPAQTLDLAAEIVSDAGCEYVADIIRAKYEALMANNAEAASLKM